MRQMKDEAEKFRTMKAEKEKEILQLKQQVSAEPMRSRLWPAREK